MTKQLPGGDYGSAWASLAAASPRRRAGFAGPFSSYSTDELIRDAFATNDNDLRARLEAEVTRRRSKRMAGRK
jgi:hypothetical protein